MHISKRVKARGQPCYHSQRLSLTWSFPIKLAGWLIMSLRILLSLPTIPSISPGFWRVSSDPHICQDKCFTDWIIPPALLSYLHGACPSLFLDTVVLFLLVSLHPKGKRRTGDITTKSSATQAKGATSQLDAGWPWSSELPRLNLETM